VLHKLFKVHETSGYGRSGDGKKAPPRALRCEVIEKQVRILSLSFYISALARKQCKS